MARVVAGVDDMERVQAGDVLITDMTDPDWEPVMKRAAGIVTRRGGRTCHAAIIARELGVPAIVGCGDTVDHIADDIAVSVCCAEGDTGRVYAGTMEYTVDKFSPSALPPLPFKVQVNMANPDLAFEFAGLPADGVGLARLEFVIARVIGFHPRCAIDFASLPDELRQEVAALSAGYESPRECYISKITESVATMAAAFAPRRLLCGCQISNPMNMLGWWAGGVLSPRKKIRCWVFAGRRDISIRALPIVLPWNARRCGGRVRFWEWTIFG